MKNRNSFLHLGVAFVMMIAMCAVLFCPVALAQSPTAGTQSEVTSGGLSLKPKVVVTFPVDWNSSFPFPESVTAGRDGYLYISVTDLLNPNNRQILRVTPEGAHLEVFAALPAVTCNNAVLLGVAFDEEGRLHVAVRGLSTGISGVYRAGNDGSMTQVMRLPDNTVPNGIAFYDGDMYVSETTQGAIWKRRRHDPDVATTPWFQNTSILAPTGWGANGIAFYRDALYIAASDAGTDASGKESGSIVRLPLRHDGSPGHYEFAAPPDPQMFNVDAIAFDGTGKMWLAINTGSDGAGGKLGTLDECGRLQILADSPGWLDDPTQVVFGTSNGTRDRLYLTNGGLNLYQPNVLSFKVGVAGVTLPARDESASRLQR